MAEAEARIAELEAEREELAGAPVERTAVAVPSGPPANDTASGAEYVTTREAAALPDVSVKGLEALRAHGRATVRPRRQDRYPREDPHRSR